MVRIWGTEGMLESTDAGKRTRLVIGDTDHGALGQGADCKRIHKAPDFLGRIIEQIQTGRPTPFDLETELHPTRMVLRAYEDAVLRR